MKAILGVPETKWDEIVKNAEACILTKEQYRYYDDASGDDLILDCAFNIKRVTFKGGTTRLYESLDFTQKEKAGKLRQSAYEKRHKLELIVPTQEELTYPSSAQQQEQQKEQEQQLAAAPPPYSKPSVGCLIQNMDASNLSDQICSNLPLQYPGTAATYQDEVLPVQAPNHGVDSLVYCPENDSAFYPLCQDESWLYTDIATEAAGVFGDNNPSLAFNMPQLISGHRLDSPMSLPPENILASYSCPNMPFYLDDTGMQQVNCCASSTLSSNFNYKGPAVLWAEKEASLADTRVSSNPDEFRTKTPSRHRVYWRKIGVKLNFLVRIRRIDSCRPQKKQKTGPLLKP
ncbi:uncharacterized protein LOC110736786 isoform X2 [Chenopodium quinoa]|uniref:uncharacterized protein LOC110736786 isoform X2 n=1 Tax=Chenopodium quinoa TaxID=63459 RepID=UPI000B776D53|nr:uncharacterized protein LOC110736786 isoform X2 [Chenopodium quinoa]